LVLGCLCLLSAAFAAQAEDEGFELQCVSADKFLQIYSDHAVDQTRCKSIAERVLRAYAFIGKQESWSNPDLLRANPLQFRLLGGSLKVLGYAKGPNLMVMKDEYLDQPLSEGTLAHELTHIQDLRQLRGQKLPSFMLEGRALTVGHAYRMYLGQEQNSYDHRMAASAARFTASEAETLLNNYRGQGWNNQAIGTVLVEYMRTKWNGNGVPNIHPRLSRMIEIMGRGAEFEAAFQKEFGTSAVALGEAFLKHLSDTQDDPRARLQDTIWQSTSPSEDSSILDWLDD
jgi:hypothetical protein